MANMNKTTDMTQGKPTKLLLGFAVPLMLGSLCQLLYTTADSAVVGRLIGVDAFAAVGAANFLSWLVYEIIFGLVQGRCSFLWIPLLISFRAHWYT